MLKYNPKVDHFFLAGCGRCSLYNTSACKVHSWTEPLQYLREIILESGLTEELKWGVPCYTFGKHNVVMLGAFKDNCVISFLKGALMIDPKGILEKPGENSQVARIIRFTSHNQVISLEMEINTFIQEALEIEKKGLKVELKKAEDYEIPIELQEQFDKDPSFEKAFKSLTPGRQRGFLLHFIQPKQTITRTSRIQKCKDLIYAGKGLNDR
ncbi:MAG: YdeI/OmpD-associated family protein [Flavobacteriia bacterium]|jgi:uncharacterized protein YdeI (YjbR/CyaY-like superfamily)